MRTTNTFDNPKSNATSTRPPEAETVASFVCLSRSFVCSIAVGNFKFDGAKFEAANANTDLSNLNLSIAMMTIRQLAGRPSGQLDHLAIWLRVDASRKRRRPEIGRGDLRAFEWQFFAPKSIWAICRAVAGGKSDRSLDEISCAIVPRPLKTDRPLAGGRKRLEPDD